MNDFLDLCAKRQSCREFGAQPIEREKLVRCVEAGRTAPSACNSQPWKFIVAQSPDVVAQIAKAGQQMGMNPFLDNAKAFIIVVEEHAFLNPRLRALIDSRTFAESDIGAATAYICLEAASQGLGSCQIGIYDREAICKALDVPPQTRIATLIAVGYPANDTIRPKTRKTLEEISRFV